MSDLITMMWEGLRHSGIPEVMLSLPDGSASRCHLNDTAIVGEVRVALLGDQDRNIVRILPIASCVGIGVPSPKGVDPLTHRGFVKDKLAERSASESSASHAVIASDPNPPDPVQANPIASPSNMNAHTIASGSRPDAAKIAAAPRVEANTIASTPHVEAKSPPAIATKPASNSTASGFPPASSYK